LKEADLETLTDIDLCSCILNKVTCFSYVVETLWFSPQQKYTKKMLGKLCAIDIDVKTEDDVAIFLEVHLECQSKLIKITQKLLTKCIINAFESWNLTTTHTLDFSLRTARNRCREKSTK
jgi:hypothetical protein